MLIKIGDFEFTSVWDGVFYKKLSQYPAISDWEKRNIIEFVEYEASHGRDCEIECEDADTLAEVNHALQNREIYRHVPRPALITECTACPYRKGCVTEFVCHTTSVENAVKILNCGSLLSAVKARNIPVEELMAESRNAANDPADYFEYIMLAWGNCQAGDRLVMERKLGRFPDETDLSAHFAPGVRFYFRYEDLVEHPGRVFDGVLPMKIKDEIVLKDWLYAMIIPEGVELDVPEYLKDRAIYVENDCRDIWDWSEKVYRVIEKRANENLHKMDAFFENARLLQEKMQIVPLLYGSLGLEYLTKENLIADDIDILIPGIYLSEQWVAFSTMLERNGYRLMDVHEHTFEHNGIHVSYARLEELKSFAGIRISDIPTLEADGIRFRLLTLEQYLKVYTASSKDGYRRDVKEKKDQEKIDFIRSCLGGEVWDAYYADGSLAGRDLVRGEPIPKGLYHLVSEILVRHTDGDYLLMQRDFRKPNYGGFFEATAGGSALKGEDALTCAMRELMEETGITTGTLTKIGRFVSHNTIYEAFLCVTDCEKDSVKLQEGETVSYKWVSEAKFIDFVNSNAMIEVQYQRYLPYFKQIGYVK